MLGDRECLNCGFPAGWSMSHCPKCDGVLNEQTDGSIWTTDIAHQGETVREAMNKLEHQINQQLREYTQCIRFVVGSGLIRDAAERRLGQLVSSGKLKRFHEDEGNRGALIAHLRNE